MNTDRNLANLLGLARTALLAGNHQEALDYFNRVLEIDPTISEAWMGKGKAAAWQSSLANIRVQEALVTFGHAIANAEPNQKAALRDEAIGEVNRVVSAIYALACDNLRQFASVDGVWSSYLNQSSTLLAALQEILQWSPGHRDTLQNIIQISTDNRAGYKSDTGTHKVSSEYGNTLNVIWKQTWDSLRAIDKSYTPPPPNKGFGGCFVVTATMGDHDHPNVIVLRQFRDDWLIKRPMGPLLISWYYRVGPSLAALISSSQTLRCSVYYLIIKPAARFAKRWTANRQSS